MVDLDKTARTRPTADGPRAGLSRRHALATLAGGAVALGGPWVIRPRAQTPILADAASALVDAAPALAMHGAPALAPGFAHLPYADPAAPAGGRLTLGEKGGFDSLNPYLIRGRAPWGAREHVVESLLERSWDEPFTLYAHLAEAVAAPADRASVAFALDPAARFSSGAPVEVEDVVFSLETLRAHGRPNHRTYYGQVRAIERLGPKAVRFVFEAPNRELPLLLGLMPILSRDGFAGRAFEEPSLAPIIGSGPYLPVEIEANRRILFRRDPEYWAAERPIMAGRHRFDEIEYLYFRDDDTLFEALAAGAIDLMTDADPMRWAEGYDFPAAREGRVVQTAIPHARPSGLDGFVFNTRRPLFADRRVREALTLALDFEWMNARFFRDGYRRTVSPFGGSRLAHVGRAEGAERALLEPFAASLPEGALEAAWTAPVGAGDGRNRAALRKARALLEAAGWSVDAAGKLVDAAGAPFAFELLLRSGDDARAADAYVDGLTALGVAATIRTVDAAQHQQLLDAFDFDMTRRAWVVSLSPGEEQRVYWGSAAADEPGSRNYMGAREPAIDACIDALLEAGTPEGFEAAARALDRVLAWGVYVAPLGHLGEDRVAHAAALAKPARDALYGYRPDVWWRRA